MRKVEKGRAVTALKRAALLAALAVLPVLFTGCGSGDKIDLEELIELDYSGPDGYARASCDYDALEEWLEENYDEATALEAAFLIEDEVSFELSPDEGLSNGDKVTVTVSYDDDLEDSLGFKLSPESGSSWTVEVDGLDEAEKIDLFENISLEYQSDGSLAVAGGYGDLTYTLSEDRGLKNGDTVTVTVSYGGDDVALEEYCMYYIGGVPASTTCEYTVEGLTEYYTSPDDIPDELMEELKAAAEDLVEETGQSMYDAFGDQGYLLNGYSYDRCHVASPQAETDGSTMNEVYLIYKLNASNPDGTFDYYYSVMFTNVSYGPDGTYAYDDSTWVPDGSYSIWTGVSGENYFCTGTEGEGFIGFETLQDFYDYYVAPYEDTWSFMPDDFD